MDRLTRQGAVTGPRGHTGSVTAELALGLVTVLLVLGAVLAVGVVAAAQVRCVDAAGAGARAAARGDDPAAVRRLAAHLAGDGARVVTTRDGDLVRVSVTRRVRLPVPGRPRLALGATASARVEVPAAQIPAGGTP